MLQCRAIQEFHVNEYPTTLLPDFMDSADVRMIECGSCSRFPAKSLEGLRILSDIVRKEFQSDKAAEFGVFCFVNHTHPTATELFQDAVVRDCLPNHGREDSLCDGC